MFGGLKSTVGSCAFINSVSLQQMKDSKSVSYAEGLYMQGLFKVSLKMNSYQTVKEGKAER